MHEFTKGSPWDELGIDLCLGAEADKPIDIRQQMFAPFYMRYFAQDAYIQTPDGVRRPLVLREEKIVDAELDTESSRKITPMIAAALFLLLNVIIGFFQWRKQMIFWGGIYYCMQFKEWPAVLLLSCFSFLLIRL